MSWNKRVVGDREGIMENVNADEMIPPTVKQSISQAIEKFPEPDGTAILLETDGHFTPGQTYSGTCNVRLSNVAKAVKAAVVALLACLVLFAAAPAQAAEDYNNRARLSIGREAAEPKDLFDAGEFRTVAGASYEHVFGDVVGFQVDASRDITIADSWQGNLDLTFHTSAFVFQVGGGYDDPTEDYSLNAGVGLDKCSGIYCAQVLLRYYRDLNSGDETEGSDVSIGDNYHLALTLGFGFGW